MFKIVSNVLFSVKPSQVPSRDPRRCSVMTIWFACNASAIIMAKGDQLSSMPDGHPRSMDVAPIQSTYLPPPLAPTCTPPLPSALWLFCINVIIVAAVAQQQAGDRRRKHAGVGIESQESRVWTGHYLKLIDSWIEKFGDISPYLICCCRALVLCKICKNCGKYFSSSSNSSRVSRVLCFPVYF